MIDPITEQILMEARIIDTAKKIVPIAKNALMKRNTSAMRKVAKILPKKNFSEVEKEAIKKIPGFRQKYKDMQRIMIKNRDAAGIEQPAALIGAVAATISDNVTPEIISMKLSEAAKNAQKLIFFPGDTALVKLLLFLIAILLIYVTSGAIILPALQYLFVGLSYLLALLGKLFSGTADLIDATRESGPEMIETAKRTIAELLS